MTTIDPASLATAYLTLVILRQRAEAKGLTYYHAIHTDHDGQIFFSLSATASPDAGIHFLRGINTTDPVIFEEKAKEFLDLWSKRIEDEGSSRERRIAALKAELARLEGE